MPKWTDEEKRFPGAAEGRGRGYGLDKKKIEPSDMGRKVKISGWRKRTKDEPDPILCEAPRPNLFNIGIWIQIGERVIRMNPARVKFAEDD